MESAFYTRGLAHSETGDWGLGYSIVGGVAALVFPFGHATRCETFKSKLRILLSPKGVMGKDLESTSQSVDKKRTSTGGFGNKVGNQ